MRQLGFEGRVGEDHFINLADMWYISTASGMLKVGVSDALEVLKRIDVCILAIVVEDDINLAVESC